MSKLDEYKTQYFTIEALENGLTVKLTRSKNFCGSCQYRINNGAWQTLTNNVNTQSINTGQTISFKGSLSSEESSGAGRYMGIGTFTISKKCNLKGNIMSLHIGDSVTNKDYNYSSFSLQNSIFFNLFKSCSTIIDASCLVLPSLKLTGSSYMSMFEECINMVSSMEELPATTLGTECYAEMFSGCKNLVNTIETLPATVLSESCCRAMFSGCTRLTTAPNINATTVNSSSCEYMFSGCTRLVNVQSVLKATTFGNEETDDQAIGCYAYMFSGCTSLTTAPELPATKVSSRCYEGMFYDCTSLVTPPPVLPAKDLTSTLEREYVSNLDYNNPPWYANSCYKLMFSGCTSLTTAPELQATELSASCYEGMFFGCSNLKYAPDLPADKLRRGCYIGMFEGCIKLSRIKFGATKLIFYTNPSKKDYTNVPIKNLDSYLYYDGIAPITDYLGGWTAGLSVGNFYIKHDIILPTSNISGIPQAWTRINDDYKIATRKYMNSNVSKGCWITNTDKCVTKGGCSNISFVKMTNAPTGVNNDKRCIHEGITELNTESGYIKFTLNYNIKNWHNPALGGGAFKPEKLCAEISTSSVNSSGSWTQLNDGKDPGNIAATATTEGSFYVKIPVSTYNLKNTQYYIKMFCGWTSANWVWRAAWGGSGSTMGVFNKDYNDISKEKQTWFHSAAIPLQANSDNQYCVLRPGDYNESGKTQLNSVGWSVDKNYFGE